MPPPADMTISFLVIRLDAIIHAGEAPESLPDQDWLFPGRGGSKTGTPY